MAPDEYTKALDKALEDLERKLLQRDLLTAQIAGDKETVRVLSSRMQLSPERQKKVAQLIALVDSATPSLTDAVRSLLTRIHPADLTAVEVRDRLEATPSFEESNISLSACHAALKRLVADDLAQLGKAPRGGKPTYCAKLNPAIQRGALAAAFYGLSGEPLEDSWPKVVTHTLSDLAGESPTTNHPVQQLRNRNRPK
jgi:hypothetical protein